MLEHLSGETGRREKVAKRYDIPDGTLKSWIEKYKLRGFDSSSKELKNNKFVSKLKLSVIQYRQTKNTSLKETAEYFNLVNESIIYRWERAYQERGLSGSEGNRGRPSKDMTRPNKESKLNTPINESEKGELIRLREENRFLRMRIIYERKLQALLLEEEAEAEKRQR